MTGQSKELSIRLKRLQRSLLRRKLDGMIVYDRFNSFYLTGFRASLSYLLVTGHTATLLVDGRYQEMAQRSVRHCEVALFKKIGPVLEKWRRSLALRRVGLEGSIPWSQWEFFQSHLTGVELVEAADLILRLRLIKSAGEIKKIEAAAALTDEIYARLLKYVGAGMTEFEVRNWIRRQVDELRAEGESFDAIVAAGPNASMPHYRPGSRKIRAGDPLLVDMGVLLDGYCSDMTRVIQLGEGPPPSGFRKVYEAVRQAEEAALRAIRPGAPAAELYRLAVKSLKRRGLARYFTHGLGHGVGLEIHEAPVLNSTSTDVLKAGMVITIEPGVYLPKQFGVRIEDLVVVTRTGGRVLSRSPKALLTIGDR
jgi:Xaa-Pro aminopeptidase